MARDDGRIRDEKGRFVSDADLLRLSPALRADLKRANKKITESVKEFNAEIDKFKNDLMPRALVLLHKKLAFEALSRVVKKTPVDTGRAKGNWQVALGTALNTELDVSDKDGDPTVDKGMQVISEIKPFNMLWITNNLIYIIVLELGSSQQAPNGMVAITVQELKAAFQ